MKYRFFPNTDLKVSEVGFGMWIVSTGWWGDYTDEQAIALMSEALELGINFFDAADTYGNGRSERLIAKAFKDRRDQIAIATKVGYDFYQHGEGRRGQREIPQDFSPGFLEFAVDQALERLETDRIDFLQLHNIRMGQVDDDAIWTALEDIRASGKIRYYGVALGPAIGWLHEGKRAVTERKMTGIQHIYNLLETHPGREILEAGKARGVGSLIRVPHSSGMLEGHYTEDTVFPPTDHRSHRPRSWLLNGIQKIRTLEFLKRDGARTLGQAALQWLLAEPTIVSTLPNIYDSKQLREFASAPETPPLSVEELERCEKLAAENFGVREDPPKYKGTMTLEPASA
ncbi:MAG: aldo/keto reductase [Verrucomicrobiae bacterium]|nr:aldo/keto reductase [Verrucomicrobiae bacterium]